MFTIILSDGTTLNDLTLNGNNFISKIPVDNKTFSGKLGHVVIDGDFEADEAGLIGQHENMQLVQIQQYGNDYWFILRDIPAEELEIIKMQGNIAYLSMMTGIELD